MKTQDLKPGENKVFYDSDGKKLASLLFLPQSYKKGEKYPAVVVTRPASGVKEQTAGLYAKKMSEKGFIGLAFDPKGYGESEGRPQVENPFSVISDTKNSVTFLQSLEAVDADKIFNIGICYAAGYATSASAEDDRIKGTATISPAIANHIEYPKAFGGRLPLRIIFNLVKPIVFILGIFGINLYFPLAPIKWWQKPLAGMPIQVGALEYYGKGKPGDTPNWKNKINLYQAEKAGLDYNTFDWVPKFKNKPFFMAYGDKGQRPDLIQKFYDGIKVKDKDLMVFENTTHFALYYKSEHVDKIVEGIARLFGKSNNQ